MINDKRIDALNAEIEEQKQQLHRQAQIIVERDKEIRELKAYNGVLERTLEIYVMKLADVRAKGVQK